MSIDYDDLVKFAKSLLGQNFFQNQSEVDYAVKWMIRGPLSSPLTTRVVGTESLISILSNRQTNDLVTVQSLAKRISKKFSRGNDLLYIVIQSMNSYEKSKGDAKLTVPVVALNELAVSLIPSKHEISSTFSPVEKFLFGDNMSEEKFIRDLIFIIQGIDGDMIRFVLFPKNSSSINIKILCPSLVSPSHIEGLIHGIAEHGILIRSISSLFEDCENIGGAIFLKQAIEIEINQFKSVAAVIEQDIANWTLLRMMVFLTIPIRKLRFIGNLVVECLQQTKKTIHHHTVLNTVYDVNKRGVFRPITCKLFNSLVRQWLNRVECWIVRGELSDKDKIFYIRSDQTSETSWEKIEQYPRNSPNIIDQIVSSGHYIWTRKFSVIDELVPKFIDKKLIEEIFIAGKSMAILRSNNMEKIEFNFPREYIPFQSLETLQSDIETFSMKSKLLESILVTNDLISHLENIKKIFLFGNCEVFEKFIFLSNSFTKNVSKYDLIFAFETAAANGGLVNEMISNFEINLSNIPSSSSENVLDQIVLDYTTNCPVDIVLDPDIVRKYYECFSLLFQLFRIDSGLRQSWRSLMGLDRRLSNGVVYLPGVDAVLRDMNHLRSVLWSWISEFRFIMMVDVIEQEWRKLVERVKTVKDVDELIQQHSMFVASIQEGLFVNVDNQEVGVIVHDIFEVVKRFLNCETAIYTELGACLQLDKNISEFRQRNILALVGDISDSFHEIADIFGKTLRESKVAGDASNHPSVSRILSRLCDKEV